MLLSSVVVDCRTGGGGELMARADGEGAPPGYGALGPSGREKQHPCGKIKKVSLKKPHEYIQTACALYAGSMSYERNQYGRNSLGGG